MSEVVEKQLSDVENKLEKYQRELLSEKLPGIVSTVKGLYKELQESLPSNKIVELRNMDGVLRRPYYKSKGIGKGYVYLKSDGIQLEDGTSISIEEYINRVITSQRGPYTKFNNTHLQFLNDMISKLGITELELGKRMTGKYVPKSS